MQKDNLTLDPADAPVSGPAIDADLGITDPLPP